jgi:alginate O-acetyltransferase complex protein AlgI
MLFVSPVFLIYFLPILLFLYKLSNHTYKNHLLLASSLIFYSWGAPVFVFVVITTTLVDFLLVKKMAAQPNLRSRKIFLIISVSLNLGLLMYFKYMNFFVNNIKALLSSAGVDAGPMLHIALPIGISFFVFESITYVVDVYRKEQEPLKDFSQYLLYIFFFPKMIAGPIIRFAELAPQLQNRFNHTDPGLYVQGFGRFVTGLAKKVMFADVLAVYTDAYIRNVGMGADASTSWLAAIAFALQVYFDFSGYSDMAIGLANMFGFKLEENFNNPFTASSLHDFWKRWHMSFTRWIKHYLYIPLGGSKKSTPRTYLNLWIVFILSGLWHGAAWNYLLWGIFHGLFLVAERIYLGKLWERTGKIISTPVVCLFVVLTTLLLKTNELQASLVWYKSLFFIQPGTVHLNMLLETKLVLGLAIIFSLLTLTGFGKKIQDWWYQTHTISTGQWIKPAIYLVLWIVSLSYVTGHSFQSFIYFMF